MPRTPELSRRGQMLRQTTRVQRYPANRSFRWRAVLSLGVVAMALLIVLGPLLLLAAVLLLLVAWQMPERLAPYLDHRWLARVPAWLRATPVRFAGAVLVLTLPLAATSYAIRAEEGAGTPDIGAATESTQAVASPSPNESASATLRPTPRARATPRTTPRTTTTPVATSEPTPDPTITVGADLSVHFLDVGQGDATVFIGPDATLLIDTGRHDRSDVVPHLRALGVSAIDVVAITHAHADHIGQLDSVLDNFDVDEAWMSGTPHTTQTFDRAITALERSGARYDEPRGGQTTTVGSLTIEILSPSRLSGDLHADSLVMRVSYGSVSFLFTGDLEAAGESGIVNRWAGSLATTIYQVGHHGSNTSTSRGFLAAVRPEVAIYSASADNQYGHPHGEVIERLTSAGVEVYGTPTHGTVSVTTDGSSYRINSGRAAPLINPIAPVAAAATPAPVSPPTASGCQPGQVDINSAAFDELQLIIHIGPDRAQQILNLRPFSSVDAMDRISGIGRARLADIKAEATACVA